MKTKIIFLIFFISFFVTKAQSKDSIQIEPSIYVYDVFKQKMDYKINFNNQKTLSETSYFYKYDVSLNSTLGYVFSDKPYQLTGIKPNIDNYLRFQKVDSFNPYGVSSAKDGLFLGFAGVLFEKLDKIK